MAQQEADNRSIRLALAISPQGRLHVEEVAEGDPGAPGLTRYAVNLLDAKESSIAPAPSLTLSGRTVAGQSSVAKGNVEVWPWLVLFALVMACLEWLVYNRKVRV